MRAKFNCTHSTKLMIYFSLLRLCVEGVITVKVLAMFIWLHNSWKDALPEVKNALLFLNTVVNESSGAPIYYSYATSAVGWMRMSYAKFHNCPYFSCLSDRNMLACQKQTEYSRYLRNNTHPSSYRFILNWTPII